MRSGLRAGLAFLGIWTGLAAGVTPAWGSTRAAAAKARRSVEAFEITKEPTPGDWRYFIKAPEAGREQLWTYQQRRGKRLKDWAWGWRLGWVRVCEVSRRAYCSSILREALADKALVVRAEAATKLGRRFEGSANQKVMQALSEAYRDKRNVRGGKPLIVQNRILYALRQIGGDAALQRGEELAAQHPETKSYWERLAAAEDSL